MKDTPKWQLWLLSRYPRRVVLSILIGLGVLVFVGVVIFGALFIWAGVTIFSGVMSPPSDNKVIFTPFKDAVPVLICVSPIVIMSIWAGYRYLDVALTKREKKK